jgi:hypothetical protein
MCNIDNLLWLDSDYECFKQKILEIIKEEHEFSPEGVCVMSSHDIADRCIDYLKRIHSQKIIKHNNYLENIEVK